jgi:hypothetical protein
MNIVIGIIIGALLVLFTSLSIFTIVGVGLMALAIYIMPSETLKVVGALILLWIGFCLIF